MPHTWQDIQQSHRMSSQHEAWMSLLNVCGSMDVPLVDRLLSITCACALRIRCRLEASRPSDLKLKLGFVAVKNLTKDDRELHGVCRIRAREVSADLTSLAYSLAQRSAHMLGACRVHGNGVRHMMEQQRSRSLLHEGTIRCFLRSQIERQFFTSGMGRGSHLEELQDMDKSLWGIDTLENKLLQIQARSSADERTSPLESMPLPH